MALGKVRVPRTGMVQLQPSRLYAASPFRPYSGMFPGEENLQSRMLQEQMAKAIVSPFQINDPNVIRAIRGVHGITDTRNYEVGRQVGGALGAVAGTALATYSYVPAIIGLIKGTYVTAAGTSVTGIGVPIGVALASLATIATIISGYQIGKTIGAAASTEGQKAWGTYLSNLGNSLVRRPITTVLNVAGTIGTAYAVSKIPGISRIPGATTITTMYANQYLNKFGNYIDGQIFGKLDDREMMSYTDFRVLSGDLRDSFTGQTIIKAALASSTGKEDFTKLIARSYGDDEEGYSPLGFNKVREAYGVDIGVFGNGLIDMLGEVFTNPARYTSVISSPIKGALKKHFINTWLGKVLEKPDSFLFKFLFDKTIDKETGADKITLKAVKKGEIGLKQFEESVSNIVENYKDTTLVFGNKNKLKAAQRNKALIQNETTRMTTALFIQKEKELLSKYSGQKLTQEKEALRTEIKVLEVELFQHYNNILKEIYAPVSKANQEVVEVDEALKETLNNKIKRNAFNVDMTLFKEFKNKNFLMDGQMLNKVLKTNSAFRHHILANQTIGSYIDWVTNPTLRLFGNKHVHRFLKNSLIKISSVLDPVKINTTMKELEKNKRDIDKFYDEHEKNINQEIEKISAEINSKKEELKEEYLKKHFDGKLDEKIAELNAIKKDDTLSEEEKEDARKTLELILKEREEMLKEVELSSEFKHFEKAFEIQKANLEKISEKIKEYKKETKGIFYERSKKGKKGILNEEQKIEAEQKLKALEKEMEILTNRIGIAKKDSTKKTLMDEKNKLQLEFEELSKEIAIYELEDGVNKIINSNLDNFKKINSTIAYVSAHISNLGDKLGRFLSFMKYSIISDEEREALEKRESGAEHERQTIIDAEEKTKIVKDVPPLASEDQKEEREVEEKKIYEELRALFGVLEPDSEEYKELFADILGSDSDKGKRDLKYFDDRLLVDSLKQELENPETPNERKEIIQKQIDQLEASIAFQDIITMRSTNTLHMEIGLANSVISVFNATGIKPIDDLFPNEVLLLQEIEKMFEGKTPIVEQIEKLQNVTIRKGKKIKYNDEQNIAKKEIKKILRKKLKDIIDIEGEKIITEESKEIIRTLFLANSKEAELNLNKIVDSFAYIASKNAFNKQDVNKTYSERRISNMTKREFNRFVQQTFLKTVEGKKLKPIIDGLEIRLKNFREELMTLEGYFKNSKQEDIFRTLRFSLNGMVNSDLLYGINFAYSEKGFMSRFAREEKYNNVEINDEIKLKGISIRDTILKGVSAAESTTEFLTQTGMSSEEAEKITENIKILTGQIDKTQEVQEESDEENLIEENRKIMENSISAIASKMIESDPSLDLETAKENATAVFGKILDEFEEEEEIKKIKASVQKKTEKAIKEKELKRNKLDELIASSEGNEKTVYEKIKAHLTEDISALEKVYKEDKVLSLINTEELHKIILGKQKGVSYKIDYNMVSDKDKRAIREFLKDETKTVTEKVVFLKSLKGHVFRNKDGVFVNFNYYGQMDEHFWSEFPELERIKREAISDDADEVVIGFFKGEKGKIDKEIKEKENSLEKIREEKKSLIRKIERKPNDPKKDITEKRIQELIDKDVVLTNEVELLKLRRGYGKGSTSDYVKNMYDSPYNLITKVNQKEDFFENTTKQEIKNVDEIKDTLTKEVVKTLLDSNVFKNIKIITDKDSQTVTREIQVREDMTDPDSEINKPELTTFSIIEATIGKNKIRMFIPTANEDGVYRINGSNYIKTKVMGEEEDSLAYLENLKNAIEKNKALFVLNNEKEFGANYGEVKLQEALMSVFFKQRSTYEGEETSSRITDFKYVGDHYSKSSLAIRKNEIYIPKRLREKTDGREELYKENNADFLSASAAGNTANLNVSLYNPETNEYENRSLLEMFVPGYREHTKSNKGRLGRALIAPKNAIKRHSGEKETPLFKTKFATDKRNERFIPEDGINYNVILTDYYGTIEYEEDGKVIKKGLSTYNDVMIIRESAVEKFYGPNMTKEKLNYMKFTDSHSNKFTIDWIPDSVFDNYFGKNGDVVVSKNSNRDRGSVGQLMEMAFNKEAEARGIEDYYYDNDQTLQENWNRVFGTDLSKEEVDKIIENTTEGKQYWYLTEDDYNEDDPLEKLEPKVTGDNVHSESSAISFEVMSTISLLQYLKINGEYVDKNGKLLSFLSDPKRTAKDKITNGELIDHSQMLEGSGGRVKNVGMVFKQPNSMDDKLTPDAMLKDNQMSITRNRAIEMNAFDKEGNFIKDAIFIRYPSKGRPSLVHVELVLREDSPGDSGKIGVSESYTKTTNTDFDGDRGTIFSLKGAPKEVIDISKKAFTHDYLDLSVEYSDFKYKARLSKEQRELLGISSYRLNKFNKLYSDEAKKKINTNYTDTFDEEGNPIKRTIEERDLYIQKQRTINAKWTPSEYDKDNTGLKDSNLRSQKVKEYAAKNQHLVDWLSSLLLLDEEFNFWFKEDFINNKSFNVLGVEDPAAIINLAREFLGQDAFDFAKRGAEESKLLDRMYEIVGPFEKDNADPKQMMIKLQYLLLAIGIWKDTGDKEWFEKALTNIKNMNFEIEETPLEKFNDDFPKTEKEVKDITKDETEEPEETEEEKQEELNDRMRDILIEAGFEEENINDFLNTARNQTPMPADGRVFVADFSNYEINQIGTGVFKLLKDERLKTGSKGEGREYHQRYYENIFLSLKRLIRTVRNNNIDGDDIQIEVNFKDENGKIRKTTTTFREAFLIEDRKNAPQDIKTKQKLVLNESKFSGKENEELDSIKLVKTTDQISQETLNKTTYDIYRGVNRAMEEAFHSLGIDKTLKSNPRLFNYYYDLKGIPEALYKDLINQDLEFNTVVGAVLKQMTGKDTTIMDDFLSHLRPAVFNNLLIKFLGMPGERALLQQHLQEAILIDGIFDTEIDGKAKVHHLSLDNPDHDSKEIEEGIKKALLSFYGNDFDYEENKNSVYTTAKALYALKGSYVKINHLQKMSKEEKINLISKLFIIKTSKSKLDIFKDYDFTDSDFISIDRRAHLTMDFADIYFTAFNKIDYAIKLSDATDKYDLLMSLNDEQKEFAKIAEEIKLLNQFLQTKRYNEFSDGDHRGSVAYDPTEERAFLLAKTGESKVVYEKNKALLELFAEYDQDGPDNLYTQYLKEVYQDTKRPNLTTLDHYYTEDINNYINFLENQAMYNYPKKVIRTLVKFNKVARALGTEKAISLNKLATFYSNILNSPRITPKETGGFSMREADVFANIADKQIEDFLDEYPNEEENFKEAFAELVNELGSFGTNRRGIEQHSLARALIGIFLFDKNFYPIDEEGKERTHEEIINQARQKIDDALEEMLKKKEYLDEHTSQRANELSKSIIEEHKDIKDLDKKTILNNVFEDNEEFVNEVTEKLNLLDQNKLDSNTRIFDTYSWATKTKTGIMKYTLKNLFWEMIKGNEFLTGIDEDLAKELKSSLDDFLPINTLLKIDEEKLNLTKEMSSIKKQLKAKDITEEDKTILENRLNFLEQEYEKVNEKTQEKLNLETEKYILNKIKKESPEFYEHLQNRKLHSGIVDTRLNMEVFKMIVNSIKSTLKDGETLEGKLNTLFNHRKDMVDSILMFEKDPSSVIFFDTENTIDEYQNIYEISYITLDENGNPEYNQKLIPTNVGEVSKHLWKKHFGYTDEEADALEKTITSGGAWDSGIKAFESFFAAAKGKTLIGQAIESEDDKSGDIERLNEAYEKLIAKEIRKTIQKHDPYFKNFKEELVQSKNDAEKQKQVIEEYLKFDKETGYFTDKQEAVRKLYQISVELTKERYRNFIYVNGDGDKVEEKQNLFQSEIQRLQLPFLNYDQYRNPKKYLISNILEFLRFVENKEEVAEKIYNAFEDELNRLKDLGVIYQKSIKLVDDNEMGFIIEEDNNISADGKITNPKKLVSVEYIKGDPISETFFKQEAFSRIVPQLLKIASSKDDANISVSEALRVNYFGKAFYEQYSLFRAGEGTNFSNKINRYLVAAEEEYAKTGNRHNYLVSLQKIQSEYNKENRENIFEGVDPDGELSSAFFNMKNEVVKKTTSLTRYRIKEQIVEEMTRRREEKTKTKDEAYITNVKEFIVRLLNYGDPNNLTNEVFKELLKLDPLIPDEIIESELQRFKNNFNNLVENNIPDRFALLEDGKDVEYEKELVGLFLELALWETLGMDSQLSAMLGKSIKDFESIEREEDALDEQLKKYNSIINNTRIENENNKKAFKEQRVLLQNLIYNKDEEGLKNYFLANKKYKTPEEAIKAYEEFKEKIEAKYNELKETGIVITEERVSLANGRLRKRSDTDDRIHFYDGNHILEKRFFKQAIIECWKEINDELYINEVYKTVDKDTGSLTKEQVSYGEYLKNLEKYDGYYEISDFELEDELYKNVIRTYGDIYKKRNMYKNLNKYQYNFFDFISAYKDSITGEYDMDALLESIKFGYLGKNFKITFITKMNETERKNFDRKTKYIRNKNLEDFRAEKTPQEQAEYDSITSGIEPLINNIDNTEVPTMKIININSKKDLEKLILLAERGEVGFTTNFDMISAQKMMNNRVRLSPVLNFLHNTVNYIQKSLMLANPMFIINVGANAIRKNYESLIRQGKVKEGTDRYLYELAKSQNMDTLYRKHSTVNETSLKELRLLSDGFAEDILEPETLLEFSNLLDNQMASIDNYLNEVLDKGDEPEVYERLLILKDRFGRIKETLNSKDASEKRLKDAFVNYVEEYRKTGFITRMILNSYRPESNMNFTDKERTLDEINQMKFVNDIYKSNIIADPFEISSRKDIREIQKVLEADIGTSFKQNTIINGVQTVVRGATQPMRYFSDYINRVARIHSVALEMSVGATQVEAYNRTLTKFFNYGEKTYFEREASVFFPFMSYAIRNLDYYLDLINNPNYMMLTTDLAKGMRTWYSDTDELVPGHFNKLMARNRGWIPFTDHDGIKLRSELMNANNFVNNTNQYINQRRNPIINEAVRAINSENENSNFNVARTLGFSNSFYNDGITAITNIAGGSVRGPADIIPSMFYRDDHTKYTPYKYRSKFGDYRNVYRDLFFPDGSRRTPSRNPYTTAKNILYKNYVNQRLMKKYRREF